MSNSRTYMPGRTVRTLAGLKRQGMLILGA
jgi:hypothetical protein